MRIGLDCKEAYFDFYSMGAYGRTISEGMIGQSPATDFVLFSPGKRLNFHPETQFENASLREPGYLLSPLWRSFLIINDIIDEGLELYHGLSGQLPFRIDSTPIKKVVTIGDLRVFQEPDKFSLPERYLKTQRLKHAVKAADIVIVFHSQVKKDLLRFTDAKAEKIRIIPPPADPVFSQKISETQKDRVEMKYELPERYLLYLGNDEFTGETSTFLKSYQLLVAAQSSTPPLTWITSTDTEKREVSRKIASEGLSDRISVFAMPVLSDLPVLFKKATFAYYLPDTEGAGSPLIQAVTFGIPLITSHNAYFDDPENKAAEPVRGDSAKEIAEIAEKLLESPGSRKQIIRNQSSFKERFSPEEIARSTLKIYQKLLS